MTSRFLTLTLLSIVIGCGKHEPTTTEVDTAPPPEIVQVPDAPEWPSLIEFQLTGDLASLKTIVSEQLSTLPSPESVGAAFKASYLKELDVPKQIAQLQLTAELTEKMIVSSDLLMKRVFDTVRKRIQFSIEADEIASVKNTELCRTRAEWYRTNDPEGGEAQDFEAKAEQFEIYGAELKTLKEQVNGLQIADLPSLRAQLDQLPPSELSEPVTSLLKQLLEPFLNLRLQLFSSVQVAFEDTKQLAGSEYQLVIQKCQRILTEQKELERKQAIIERIKENDSDVIEDEAEFKALYSVVRRAVGLSSRVPKGAIDAAFNNKLLTKSEYRSMKDASNDNERLVALVRSIRKGKYNEQQNFFDNLTDPLVPDPFVELKALESTNEGLSKLTLFPLPEFCKKVQLLRHSPRNEKKVTH